MEKTLKGSKHQYQIESTVDSNDYGTTYSAFARRNDGRTVKRQYYAIIEKKAGVDVEDFKNEIRRSLKNLPYQIHIEEKIVNEDEFIVVVAKGAKEKKGNGRWASLQNKGLLMVILAAIIMILMIIRFFQSPSDDNVVKDDKIENISQ